MNAKFVKSPTVPKGDAKYLNDSEAKSFLSAVQNEKDIRIKTVLILDLFTGMRRGELCGLEWSDIHFLSNKIDIHRASQYISGSGVFEVPTKNNSSKRTIDISQYVVDTLNEYRKW